MAEALVLYLLMVAVLVMIAGMGALVLWLMDAE